LVIPVRLNNPEKLRDGLSKVMPGIQWARWKNAALPARPKMRHDLAHQIAAYLVFQPDEVREVTCRGLRKAIDLTNTPRTTFMRATDEALRSVPWERRGQRLVRDGRA
jgi:hypothetical protein